MTIRDIQVVLLKNEELLIATDNSGGIGTKELDFVQVPYEVVSYFAFRVAAMELLAAGGTPEAIVTSNFCGDDAWPALMDGIQQGLHELGLTNVTIGGSTESNFSLSQSAFGLTILGKKKHRTPMGKIPLTAKTRLAVIGCPLVGQEVLTHRSQLAPLPLVQQMTKLREITLLPVGSKGIAAKVQRLLQEEVRLADMECELNLVKSSGPATCFLAAFTEEHFEHVKKIAGDFYHELTIKRHGM